MANKCVVVTAPENSKEIESKRNCPKIFLAGTIDSGNSENWQEKLCEAFKDMNVVIFNPRRNPWPKDAGRGEVDKQIKWELEHLRSADLIIMNILPDSKSPISLMEIGLFAESHKMVVFCNEKFYRHTNVKVVCDTYDIPLFDDNSTEYIADIIKRKLIVNRSKKAYSDWEL